MGVDFDKVFAPVVRMEMEIHHMDVKSVLLNGELVEEVYVQQPPVFVDDKHGHMVLKLRKALYGLWQASRAWTSKLDSSLVTLGFERSKMKHAMYRRAKDGTFLLIGIKVKQAAGMITLCQCSYACKVLESTGMVGCNPCLTPMENWLNMTKKDNSATVDATEYRIVVGSLRYLVNTRPDIAYDVGIVSWYMEAPTSQHMAAMKHIPRYVSGTVGYGCCYKWRGALEPELVGYNDSDLTDDVDDRKSTSGMAFFLGEKAKRVKLMVDNKSAIALCKNPVHNDRSKHIDTRYHFICKCIEDGKVDVEHVSTDGQLTDILTKALGRVKFIELRQKLGVVEVKSRRHD
uniref:PH01B019A14.1 protein n=1 Tax=Phyllostachys edulis TaxID=38705 RepID=L0P2F3_PHYED|nr:PH01B019A14.1 [Phyllostachys edulis]